MPASPPPLPPAAQPERPARNRLPIVIGAGVVIAAILGFVLGSSGGGQANAGDIVKSNAAMKLKVPGAWADAPPPQIPGLTLSDPKAATGEGSTVSFGTVRGANTPSLLSPALLQAAGGVPKNRTAVKLGPTRAGVPLRRRAPPGHRPAGHAVHRPDRAGRRHRRVPADLEHLRRRREHARATRQRHVPRRAERRLRQGRRGGVRRAQLGGCRGPGQARQGQDPAAQAAAARQLQNAYRHAAATLRNLQLSPADRGINARLVAALAALAKAYGQAATAAAHNDKAGFQKARAAITKDQGELNAAIANLRDAGYEVES